MISLLKPFLPWLLLGGAIAGAAAYIYDQGRKTAEAEAYFENVIDRQQERIDTMIAESARDSAVRAARDSARADTLEDLRRAAHAFEIDRRRQAAARDSAAAAVAATGVGLEDYLAIKRDTASVRLLREHRAADAELAAANVARISTLESALMNAELAAAIWENRYLDLADELDSVRELNAAVIDQNVELRAQAELWFRKSHPGFVKSTATKLLWAGVGYAACWSIGKATDSKSCIP